MIARYFSCLAFVLSSISVPAQDLSVRDAWIATAAPGISNHSGYLIIENHSQQPLSLLSVSSPVFSRIEIHRTVTENNISGMQQYETLIIPAAGRLELKPGDFHLMLYNANKALKASDTVPLQFEFSDITILETTSEVRNMTDLFQQAPDNQQTLTSPNRFAALKVSYQHLLPQHFLSGLIYKITRAEWKTFKNLLIKAFIKLFNVDMSIATQPDPRQYKSFNAFFTRQLKSGARPVDTQTASIISPVDGTVSQFGHIREGRLFQAKGREFLLSELLGGDQVLASRFMNGDFITLYLSPRDYHRIHMPIHGDLQSMLYVPGKLFSVSPATAQGIDNLYARNERVINIFDTEIGSMALIMVGAIFVGSMETVWAGEITPAAVREQSINGYDGRDIHLQRGEEAGRFNMGSTVILLFESGKVKWDPRITSDMDINMGQKIAEILGLQ